ncbi:hypothetical protein DAEQUDRAFT_727418 [Daedalea quercina L-15889]|uniref:Uncharacterized protein n=1 Tax=Daedalea quercina L-15889 TaxID=1314783 RepID=A0A165PY94_9APHY|nr:hypothetical protein DAEQUDRAFT_727418 [Daedalea quercina L-15889]
MADTHSVDAVIHATTTEEWNPSAQVTHPHMPLEVWEQIFDHLAIGMDFDGWGGWNFAIHTALACCALVCKDWYYLTWYHLRHRVTLQDRMDVTWLSQTLRKRPRLREVVRLVKIQGTSSNSGRGQVRHLGTFAVMLAGRLPNVETIVVEDATFTAGSVRMEDISYLATFHSVRRLAISSTTFASTSQLARLVSVLPACQSIHLSSVDCAPTKYRPLTLLPFNHANIHYAHLHWVETPVMDMFTRISEVCRLRYLSLSIDVEAVESSTVSKTQALLNASAESLEVVQLFVDDGLCPTLPMNEAARAAVERYCTLSRHTHLRFLDFWLAWHDASALSWIVPVLSFVTSELIQRLVITIYYRPLLSADNVEVAMLTRLETHDDLVQLDEILQHERFSTIRAICFAVKFSGFPLKECKASLARFREEHFARFNELIKQKMPRSCQRDLVEISAEPHMC